MRVLVVGDVHATVDELEDCEKLADLIVKVASEEKPLHVVFLGDLYDAHAIVNVIVQRFWMKTLNRLEAWHPILLLGNHDRPGDASRSEHALQVHLDQAIIIDTPTAMGPMVFAPYYHDREKFVAEVGEMVGAARKLGYTNPTLFCHQTFDGAKYENGFPAKDGVDQNLIDAERIIAGHIHTPAEVGKVWYVGAPRWRTASDANVGRHIYVIDFDERGMPVQTSAISTAQACRVLHDVTLTPNDPADLPELGQKPGDRIIVNLKGPSSFIEERRRQFAGQPGVRIRTFPTDRATPKVSEAEGVPKAFQRHLTSYKPKYGTSKERLEVMVQERVRVA